jgi:hypothetical protein
MSINPIYVQEVCPLEGYEALSVRVLANSTDKEWRQWAAGNLGLHGCEQCAKLNAPKVARGRRAKAPAPSQEPVAPIYCPSCTAARNAYGQAIATFYGPTLLEHDVSTPAQALALLDRDDALPSELVIWLQLVPSAVRQRRQETLLGNLISS